MADLTLDGALLLLDAATFALLGGGLLLTRFLRPPEVAGSREAFGMLERSIASNLVGMPEGYTWEEAVGRIRGLGVSADWDGFEEELADYQASRFGGRPAAKDWHEVVRLAMRLKRRKIEVRA